MDSCISADAAGPKDALRCHICGASLSGDWGICPDCERKLIEARPQKTPREELNAFMSTWDAGIKWGITKRQAAKLCSHGCVAGAFKKNETWYIPIDAAKPVDHRARAEKRFAGSQRKYISTWVAAQEWGLSQRYVAKLCAAKKIEGVVRGNSSWEIPADAANPSQRKTHTY